LRRLPVSVKAVAKQGSRSFWNSSGRKAAAGVAAARADLKNPYDTDEDDLAVYNRLFKGAYADKPAHGTLLYKYGTLNLWGLGILAALSKEVYVLDAIAVTGWIPDIVVISVATYLAGPMLSKGYEEDKLKDKRLKVENYEALEAVYDMKLREITALENQPKALDQFVTEYKEVLEQQSVAEVQIAKYNHYAETVAELEGLLGKKASRAALEGDVDAELILDHVLNSFKTDSALVSKSVDEAIQALNAGEWNPTLVSSFIADYKKSAKFQADRAAKLAELAPEE